MKYKIADLKREIRIALDQNMTSTQLEALADVDTLSLEDIIGSTIESAARTVERDAPVSLLDSGKPFADSIEWENTRGIGSGRIYLPDDFLRLITFQMSDWDYQVTVAIDEDDPKYPMQHSRYPGVRGCPQKPVVAIVQCPAGLVLEFYSCTSGDRAFVKKARYIPIPKIEGEFIGLCEKLKPAIVYYAAYLVALSIGAEDLSKNMMAISSDLAK